MAAVSAQSSSMLCRFQTLITEVLDLAAPLPALSIPEHRMCSWVEACHSFQYFPFFAAEVLTFTYVYQMYKNNTVMIVHWKSFPSVRK